MKLDFTTEAENNLRAIQSYIARENIAAATRVASTIRASIELLATYPLIGQVYEGEVRRLNVPRYPYSVFYRVEAEVVTIIAIRHGYRKLPTFS